MITRHSDRSLIIKWARSASGPKEIVAHSSPTKMPFDWLNARAIPWEQESPHFRWTGTEPVRSGMSESAQQSSRAARAIAVYSRLILTVGFGGLLLLMGFAGFDAIQTIRQIQKSDDYIREDFLSRTR